MFPNWLTDLQIEFAPVPSTLDNLTARGVLWQAAPKRFLLDAPDVARYLVEDGHRLTLHRAPSADEADVIRFARTTPLAALLYQRGMFAFHAAVVAPPTSNPSGLQDPKGLSSGAILLAGDSGAGKSTLLAALLQNGWQMLADELAIVDLNAEGKPQVFPTHPEILLWDEAIEKLNLHDKTSRVSTTREVYLASNQFSDSPLPVRAIYWLTVHNKPQIETEAVRGKDFFQAINMLLYNSHIADALLDRASHFRLASALTQTVSLHRLKRPQGQWSVEEFAEQLNSNFKLQICSLKFVVCILPLYLEFEF